MEVKQLLSNELIVLGGFVDELSEYTKTYGLAGYSEEQVVGDELKKQIDKTRRALYIKDNLEEKWKALAWIQEGKSIERSPATFRIKEQLEQAIGVAKDEVALLQEISTDIESRHATIDKALEIVRNKIKDLPIYQRYLRVRKYVDDILNDAEMGQLLKGELLARESTMLSKIKRWAALNQNPELKSAINEDISKIDQEWFGANKLTAKEKFNEALQRTLKFKDALLSQERIASASANPQSKKTLEQTITKYLQGRSLCHVLMFKLANEAYPDHDREINIDTISIEDYKAHAAGVKKRRGAYMKASEQFKQTTI